MPIIEPIVTAPTIRRIAAFDLEWIPAEEFCPNYEADVKKVRACSLTADHPGDCKFVEYSPHSAPLKLRLGGFFDGTEYVVFEKIENLIDHMLQDKYAGYWIYAHAGGLADIHFVFECLLDRIRRRKMDYQIKSSFSGSSAIIVTVKVGKKRWFFIDSYWLLRDKLESIGKHLGMNKLAAEERKTAKERRKFYAEAPLSVLMPYLEQDCRILYEAITKFEEYVLSIGGELKMTIASTGMTLFRRAFQKSVIPTGDWINSIARRAYFASRVEVVSRNATDFKLYDINSSFPYSMTFPQPCECVAMSTEIPDDENEIFISDVLIHVPEMHLPPVPYRHEGRVFFPTGTWRTYLSSVDIYLAMKYGCKILKVYNTYHFNTFNDLKEYAETIYAKRASSLSSYEKLVLKYLLNSLYGKFAEGDEKQTMLINPEVLDRINMKMMQPGVFQETNRVTVPHVHVAVSMHITAIARRTLYEFAAMCYQQGRPFYYCDTDSLATPADLPIDDTKLGSLKLEKSMKWAEFILPKIYRGEGLELQKNGTWKDVRLEKAKGFSLGTKEESWNRLESIIKGEPIGIQRMIRVKESLSRLTADGDPVTHPVEVRLFKRLAYERLTKRRHYPDGETRPWKIDELVTGNVVNEHFTDDELLSYLRASGADPREVINGDSP